MTYAGHTPLTLSVVPQLIACYNRKEAVGNHIAIKSFINTREQFCRCALEADTFGGLEMRKRGIRFLLNRRNASPEGQTIRATPIADGSSGSEDEWMTEYESKDESDFASESEADSGTASDESSESHPAIPVLCRFCAAMTNEALQKEPGYDHVPDIRDIEPLSLTCQLCYLLKLALIAQAKQCTPADEKESVDTVGSALAHLSPYMSDLQVDLQETCPVILTMKSSPLARPQKLHIRIARTEGRHATLISVGYVYFQKYCAPLPLLPRLEEDELVQRFAYKLREGERQAEMRPAWSAEENVDQFSQERRLPHRVLDLGAPTGTNDPTERERDLRLVEGLGREENYATLSYSWGSYRGFLTTQENLSERRELIKFQDLPKAFQQAGYLTRRMGIRYLWIDALCIIQDSKEDWEQELPHMADIYRNCRIRLAASAARDPTQSFYPPKPIVPSVRLVHLEKSPRGRGSRHKYYNPQFETCLVTLPKSFSDDVESAYLNSRAWVLQERMLAPNTMHFCENHIYLETVQTIIGEDFLPSGQTLSSRSCIEKFGMGRSRLMQIEPRNPHNSNKSDRVDTSDSWHRLVEIFSDCKMTYSTDKLAAISGLVKDRQMRGKFPYLQSRYGLGLWENTLHEDLLWIAHDPKALLPLLKSPRRLEFVPSRNLPSWTWAAFDGPVTFMKDARDLQEPWTMQVAPVPEFQLIRVSGPFDSDQLPLREAVSISILCNCARIPRVRLTRGGARTSPGEDVEESFQRSPFRHHPNTDNRPVLLSTRNAFFEMRDLDSEIIGFTAMDTMEASPPDDDRLWCAHIATQHDERYVGLDPLRRSRFGPSIDSVSLHNYRMSIGKDYYQETPDSYVLAYCLILESTGTAQDEYRRVGVAQVKYEWISTAPKQRMTLL